MISMAVRADDFTVCGVGGVAEHSDWWNRCWNQGKAMLGPDDTDIEEVVLVGRPARWLSDKI